MKRATGRLLISLLLASCCAHFAGAQGSFGTTVSGIVYDSIAKKPLGGATVQLVTGDVAVRFGSSAVADSLGRFTFADVPDGRFMLGFFHPLLDSIGLNPTVREVFVRNARPARINLAIPSLARLRTTICGESASAGALVVGHVRDARDGSAAAGVTVTGEWLELSFTAKGMVRGTASRVARTAENGWFGLCNVPIGGAMRLIASRGADSTAMIPAEVPPSGLLRRELSLGTSRVIVTGDTTSRDDSSAVAVWRQRVGTGRLTGSVVEDAGGAVLAGAVVRIADGPETRTNDRGEWTLRDVPTGTRMLEVLAVGRYPERRAIDVEATAPPVHVRLARLKTVLDTMKVIAQRTNRMNFAERRRAGAGNYYTGEDLKRRGVVNVSDFFRSVSGMRLVHGRFGERRILMRAAFGGMCSPKILVNGMPIFSNDAMDLDSWIEPDGVDGVEVYTGAFTPVEYQDGLSMNPCGAILIWRK